MIVVPQNKIVAIPENDLFKDSMELIVEPFKGNKKRDWFIKHAYFCLPLVIGNQYGFGIKALKTFSVIWDGGDSPASVKVEILDTGDTPDYQSISSHFGMGTVTIQNRFTFRTPPCINLMTINPPNYWIDGIQHMTGVVETDNLRRDFTFNLKVTRVNEKIIINKGDFIGCVLPIPRYFSDSFELVNGYNIFTEEQIKEEQQIMRDFGVERSSKDSHKKHGNGRRYHNGEDVYGNKFPDHQRGM
jgi:hypothetical protein